MLATHYTALPLPSGGMHSRLHENDPKRVLARNLSAILTRRGLSVRGLTKEGQPFDPTKDELRMLWDGNHEFGLFVVEASRELSNFIEEKKTTS